MTEYKKIFLDTTPIIYFLDADINYAEKVEQLFEEFIEKKCPWQHLQSPVRNT